ncbi:MAG: hypothetical protein BWK80_25635 [Desulfobacteraceae bacterium IS3]|nr:MAG: hypothetical protein BWK80_25635 [Desulfobacteraceae bacterium IS3]
MLILLFEFFVSIYAPVFRYARQKSCTEPSLNLLLSLTANHKNQHLPLRQLSLSAVFIFWVLIFPSQGHIGDMPYLI